MGRSRSNTRGTAHSYPRGIIEVTRAGYGFVKTAEGEFFVPAGKMNGAFDGDLVEVSPARQERSRKALARAARSTKKREARVKRVIERAHADIIGRFERAEPFGVVVPEDPRIAYDIFTMLADNPDIPDGAIVRVALHTYPSNKEAATGSVVEVLGDDDDERLPIDLVIARHKLETAFSPASTEQADAALVDAQAALDAGYRDLRERFVFTIDPDDARDFDDAVSIEPLDGHGAQRVLWRVGVHIADVAHYVPWGSSVDLDARRRATSVYLADRVIPMLPEALSNDVCSLKPNEDRRSMTVDMVFDETGRVRDVDIYPALIRSNARLTYEQAQELIELHDESGELARRVKRLSALAQKRMVLRAASGGLDFDTVEAKVKLDDAGVPLGIALRKRTDATQLIEEAMIAANEAVARYLRDKGLPGVFRIHEKPSRDSLKALLPVLQEFPWFKGVSPDLFVAGNPHEIAKVLRLCANGSEGTLVTTLVLRSMKRAEYSAQLDAHYALASEAYLHFTSPIRRYPDLVVHRMLKASLGRKPQKYDQEVANLPWIAEHSSEMERIAERAERESQEVKMVEFMESQVGSVFSAVVTGVVNSGLFVRLDNTAEGMVDVSDLGREYFSLDPVRHTLTGSDTGKQFRLGKCLAVRLVEADRRSCRLRFVVPPF